MGRRVPKSQQAAAAAEIVAASDAAEASRAPQLLDPAASADDAQLLAELSAIPSAVDYRDHPADIVVVGRSDRDDATAENAIESMLLAMTGYMTPLSGLQPRLKLRLVLTSERFGRQDEHGSCWDGVGQACAEELLAAFHLHKFAAKHVRVRRVRDGTVVVDAVGDRMSRETHEQGTEVKAITRAAGNGITCALVETFPEFKQYEASWLVDI